MQSGSQQRPGAIGESADRPVALARFVAPAEEGRRGAWRILLVIALTLVFGFVLATVLGIGLALGLGETALEASMDRAAGHPASLPIMLSSIFLFGVAALVAVPIVHGRRAGSLFGAWRRFRPGPAIIGALATMGVSTLIALIMAGLGLAEITWRPAPYPTLSETQTLGLIIFIALLIPLQSGSEELVFRGYLLQETARYSRSPLVWAVLPSILFGLIHYDPGAGQGMEIWALIFGTGVFGLCAAILTARSADLSLAIGVHAGNNILALLIFEGPFGLNGPGPLRITPGFPLDAPSGIALVAVFTALETLAILLALLPYATRLGRSAPLPAAPAVARGPA